MAAFQQSVWARFNYQVISKEQAALQSQKFANASLERALKRKAAEKEAEESARPPPNRVGRPRKIVKLEPQASGAAQH
jgi:hypothetical protein